MSTGGNEWIAWVMLCVSLCTSITGYIHMEATVAVKICISLRCTTAERTMWRATEGSVELGAFPFEHEHLRPQRASLNASVHFPSEGPSEKRFTWGLSSHLDGPEVRGWGWRDRWRRFRSLLSSHLSLLIRCSGKLRLSLEVKVISWFTWMGTGIWLCKLSSVEYFVCVTTPA